MKNPLAKVFARYDALQPRERLLIALGLLGGIVLVTFSAFIDPALKRGQQAERTSIEQRAQLQGLQAQMVALQSPNMNPDVAARVELDGLKQQLNELAARLQTMEQSLVPPQQMSALLEDMIGPRSGIRLLGLRTLPPMPLLERKADAKEASKPPRASDVASAGLFKHGVEIRLEGSYQDLSAYLARLEQSKMKLLWSTVSLSAINHPKLVLTLTVYTLSLDRAWLIV